MLISDKLMNKSLFISVFCMSGNLAVGTMTPSLHRRIEK